MDDELVQIIISFIIGTIKLYIEAITLCITIFTIHGKDIYTINLNTTFVCIILMFYINQFSTFIFGHRLIYVIYINIYRLCKCISKLLKPKTKVELLLQHYENTLYECTKLPQVINNIIISYIDIYRMDQPYNLTMFNEYAIDTIQQLLNSKTPIDVIRFIKCNHYTMCTKLTDIQFIAQYLILKEIDAKEKNESCNIVVDNGAMLQIRQTMGYDSVLSPKFKKYINELRNSLNEEWMDTNICDAKTPNNLGKNTILSTLNVSGNCTFKVMVADQIELVKNILVKNIKIDVLFWTSRYGVNQILGLEDRFIENIYKIIILDYYYMDDYFNYDERAEYVGLDGISTNDYKRMINSLVVKKQCTIIPWQNCK